MSFGGFSEDDIRKLTNPHEASKGEKGTHKPIKKVTFKHNNVKFSTNNSYKSAKLSLGKELKQPSNNIVPAPLEKDTRLNTVIEEPPQTQEAAPPEAPSAATATVNHEKKGIDLEEFEARQKLMEEQNRKRKELLSKALADRTKQTQEETQRLNEIREEFKMLDAILSNDVKILRKQIEVASAEYTECQKRYQRVEKEFLEAKLLFHQKLEKKELLTEHLCTIIEKNEERKAEKLTELLNKLQINNKIDSKDVQELDSKDVQELDSKEVNVSNGEKVKSND